MSKKTTRIAGAIQTKDQPCEVEDRMDEKSQISSAEEQRFITSRLGVSIIRKTIEIYFKDGSNDSEDVRHNIRCVADLIYVDRDIMEQEFDTLTKVPNISIRKPILRSHLKHYIEILEMRCMVAPTITTMDDGRTFMIMNKGATFKGVSIKPEVLEKITTEKNRLRSI